MIIFKNSRNNKMKKLLVLTAIATAFTGSAMAASVSLSGVVEPVCQISGVDTVNTFSALAVGHSLQHNITVQCNDSDGAEITLKSTEGLLESSDHEDQGIAYQATFKAGDFDFALIPTNWVNGDNDLTVTGTSPGSVALAQGVPGTLVLELLEEAVFAGTYTDTLQIAITAR